MNFKKIWTDPVWSKVIATIITGVAVISFAYISAIFNKTTIKTTITNFLTIKISLWLIVLLAILFVFFFSFVKRKKPEFKYDDETLKLDKQMFEKFKKILPQDGSIKNIRHFHSFLGFNFEDIEDLENFEKYSDYSDFEFFHPNLERIKKDLFNKVDGFTLKAHLWTKTIDNKRKVVPIPEDDKEKYKEMVDSLDARARAVVETYDELIKSGRKILKI